jgi:hypothetical protein
MFRDNTGPEEKHDKLYIVKMWRMWKLMLNICCTMQDQRRLLRLTVKYFNINPLGASVHVEGPPLGAGPFNYKGVQGHSGPLDWPRSILRVYRVGH